MHWRLIYRITHKAWGWWGIEEEEDGGVKFKRPDGWIGFTTKKGGGHQESTWGGGLVGGWATIPIPGSSSKCVTLCRHPVSLFDLSLHCLISALLLQPTLLLLYHYYSCYYYNYMLSSHLRKYLQLWSHWLSDLGVCVCVCWAWPPSLPAELLIFFWFWDGHVLILPSAERDQRILQRWRGM